jgi:hypothetical protein
LALQITSLAVALVVAQAAIAQSLDLKGSYGNLEGCESLASGDIEADALFVLEPDSVSTNATGCEFVQVLRSKGGA